MHMTDPVGFVLLSIVGTAALTAGTVGLRRGRSVSIVEPLRFYRAEKPLFFWCVVAVQLTVGITCVAGAIRAV
jgi:uncharacterized membrane protein YidH (DUF202 family)